MREPEKKTPIEILIDQQFVTIEYYCFYCKKGHKRHSKKGELHWGLEINKQIRLKVGIPD